MSELHAMYPSLSVVFLHIWDAEVEIDVFIDSGNGCTEPLSGAPVHFVSLKVLEKHIPEDLKKPLLAWDPQGTPSMSEFPDGYHKQIRLIRLMTVQGRSWAVGFRFNRWIIRGRQCAATRLYCGDKK